MSLVQIPKVIAHRGASGYAPENTLAAFKKAAALGAQWVEFDVMLTADGEPIVFHDETLERTTNGHGYLSKTTYEQLEKLDAGQGERIPRLTEVIACLSQNNLGANIELKPSSWHQRQTALKTLSMIKNHWPAHLPKPLVSSFNVMSLVFARKADPEVSLGLILSSWNPVKFFIAKQLRCVSIHLLASLLTRARVAEIKKMGYLVLAYTVNDAAQARMLFEWGVDAVFSDYPDKIL